MMIYTSLKFDTDNGDACFSRLFTQLTTEKKEGNIFLVADVDDDDVDEGRNRHKRFGCFS